MLGKIGLSNTITSFIIILFSEESWSEIEEFHRNMTTKLNHKNGDKTLQEDLLSERQEKIGDKYFIVILILFIFISFDLNS